MSTPDNNEPSDPVERADARRATKQDGDDVTVHDDGTVEQRPHGNMDSTLLAKGKDHPEQGPYVPEHDKVDPDVDPEEAPRSKDDLGA